ncbi:UNKNOWN [Stylonychia lemnae]|uniref:Uncharacterized protein n=1 Tax=Stylonychia lemnae TaxID=5949 RepID=A0A077ZR53_STYLE|nr:UNKNOWN [Stylonychia lemnae]|eukprot:CDW72393.1 UNKNOWN [Stylonychia lemnae]
MDIVDKQDDQVSNHSENLPEKPLINREIKHEIQIFNDLDASDIRMEQLNFLLSNRSQSISASNSQYGGSKKGKTQNITAHLKFPIGGTAPQPVQSRTSKGNQLDKLVTYIGTQKLSFNNRRGRDPLNKTQPIDQRFKETDYNTNKDELSQSNIPITEGDQTSEQRKNSYYSPNLKFKRMRGQRRSTNDDLQMNTTMRSSMVSKTLNCSKTNLVDYPHQSKIFQHYNPVGPADYTLPKLFTDGKHTIVDSKIKNKPSYSFGQKHSVNAIISSQHKQELLGKDSPGVGFYESKDIRTINESSLKNYEQYQSTSQQKNDLSQSPSRLGHKQILSQFGSSERFFLFENQRKLWEQVPIQYDQNQNSGLLQKSFVNEKMHEFIADKNHPDYGPQHRKTKIFGVVLEKFDNEVGPGTYEIQTKYSDFNKQNTSGVYHKKSKSIFNKDLTQVLNPIPDRFEHTKRVFCREWKVDHINKESQGPGIYDIINVKIQKPADFSFPKLDRGLLTLTKNNSPSPTSYNAVDLDWANDQFAVSNGIQTYKLKDNTNSVNVNTNTSGFNNTVAENDLSIQKA